MLSECKKCSIKNIITKILHGNQSDKKHKSIGKVEVEDNLYQTIASEYESILGAIEEANNDITFRKVAVVMDEMKHGQHKVERDGPQVSPITWLKSEYFQLYSFMIGSIAIDQVPINIIDSGAEALLLSQGQEIMKTYSRDVRVAFALLDKLTQIRRMKLIDNSWLYRVSNSEVVKLVVKRSLDTTDYERLDILLNLNLLQEAGLYVYNIL